jgi:hypothetical protein
MNTPKLERGPSYGPTHTFSFGKSHTTTPRASGYEQSSQDDYFKPITRKEEKDIELLLLRRRSSRTVTRAQLALSAIRGRKTVGKLSTAWSGSSPTGPESIVEFDGDDDPYNPINWPFKKKVIATILYGLTTLGASFASAVYSPCIKQVHEEFDVDLEIARLGTALLLFGFGLGPMLWAPLSELRGRKQVVLGPMAIAAMFAMGSGAAKDIQTLLITRFFTGFFSSAPMCITGGVLKDMWLPRVRGVALVGYGLSVLVGPLLGPLVGGAIVQSALGWRWTQYVSSRSISLSIPAEFHPDHLYMDDRNSRS